MDFITCKLYINKADLKLYCGWMCVCVFGECDMEGSLYVANLVESITVALWKESKPWFLPLYCFVY